MITGIDSTPKTIFVAVALCLFCSMIVASAAVSLRPTQGANKLRDKQVNILQVAGLYEPGIDVGTVFASFEPRIVDMKTGTFTDVFDAATFDDRAASSDPELSTELKDDPALIGFAVPIGILEKKDVVAIGYVNATIPWQYTGWNMKVICKNRMLVRHPVSIGIFEHDQAVRFLLTGLDVRVKRTAHHP